MHFFNLARDLRARFAVIYISPALEELPKISDRITCCATASWSIGPRTPLRLAARSCSQHMVGGDITYTYYAVSGSRRHTLTEKVLAVENVTMGLIVQEHVVSVYAWRGGRHRRPHRLGAHRGPSRSSTALSSEI